MNVVVVGASSGIGREVAHVFARKGHRVTCAARDEEELRSLAADLKIRYGGEVHALPVDLGSPEAIEKFLDAVYKTCGTVDCIVVTAGNMPAEDMQYHDKQALLFTTMVNYTGIALILNDVSRHMTEKGGGTIICLSSVAGERGRAGNFVYGASKSALTTYLQGLRVKLYKDNVHVTTVLPGYVDTPMSYGKVNRRLAVSPRYAAEKIWKLTEKKKDVVYIPSIWWLIMKIVKSIPESIFKRINLR